MTELSLLHGPLHAALLVAVVLGTGVLLLRRGRPWWTRRVPVAAAGALLLVAAVWLLLDVTHPWPDPLPLDAYAWIGVGLLAPVLLAVGWAGRRWWVRVLGAGAALLVVLGAADGVDAVYGSFPTLATALQLPMPDEVDARTVLDAAVPAAAAAPAGLPAGPLAQTWHPPQDLPAHGAVTQVAIPGTRSGFTARPAWIYLPPAYLTAHRPLLPVLVLIGGQPGSPRDWLDGGRLAQRMDDFAAAHAGLAPVVVMPDALGGEVADPLCTDSALGHADTYLAQDVVDWVDHDLQVDQDTAHWAVGGLSYGGTCALQLAVAHPTLFPTFYDASGQQGPTLGDPQRTAQAAFGGDAAALAAVDPLQELRGRVYPGSAGYLVVGTQDPGYAAQQRTVAAAATAAGMAITATQLPGRHEWKVWGDGLTDALPWLAHRTGLTS
ncbi:esterase family protein [Geodermatophilus sp. TF02-6]|uniref:alpha/beta hydrolase n=1 Tax=Geodermatophilus sp. TF02-6 TaxID=2250575 RepID=UPI0018F44600|nr:alpha/beta hydrolase-fold protein [Geodermatophilus sp. TF02-6]